MRVLGVVEDRGIDADGDKIFDSLEIDVKVDIEVAGN